MRTHELTLAKARQETFQAEAASRRLTSATHGTSGRTSLTQVWTAVRANLTAPSASVAR